MVHDPHRTHPAAPGQARTAEEDDVAAYDPSVDRPAVRAANGEGGEAGEGGGERVAKLLARAGVGSRRDVERLIGEGRVALNGRTLDTPAVKVEPGDILTVDGEVVGEPEPARVFRYHKPVGLVTTHKDPAGRPTVFFTLPKELPRLISVGRLDINSEGLLLLTNDGELARALEMPSTQIVRRYRARAHGRTTQEILDTLQAGVVVDGVRYGPIEAKLDKAKEGPQGANLWLTVTLHEGKNREVRRVLESIGLKVNRLIRLAYGPFALGTLGVGEIEEVGPRVIREQLAAHIAPENLPTGERPQYRVKPRTTRRGTETADGLVAEPTVTERPEKMEYKPGWAKPKHKPRPAHLKTGSKPSGEKTRTARPSAPKGERMPAELKGRPDTRVKPGARGRPAARTRPDTERPRGDRPDPRPDARPTDRSSRPEGPARGAARPPTAEARAERKPAPRADARAEARTGPQRERASGARTGDAAKPPRSAPARSGPPRSGPPRSGSARSGPRPDRPAPGGGARPPGRSGPPRRK